MNKDIIAEIAEIAETEPLLGTELELEPPLPWYRKPSLVSVCILAALMGSTAMKMSVTETLLFDRACDSNRINGVCTPADNQILVGTYQQWASVSLKIALIMGLYFIHGKMNQKIGRTPILIALAATTFAASLIFTVAVTSFKELKFKTLIFSNILGNCAGGSSGLLGVVSAYVADISTAERRALSMSIMLSALFASQFIAQFVTTQIAIWGQHYNYTSEACDSLVLSLATLMSGVIFLYTLVIPESLNYLHKDEPVEQTAEDPEASTSVGRAIHKLLIDPLKILTLPTEDIPEDVRYMAPKLRLSLMAVIFAYVLTLIDISSIILQYGIYKFKWESQHLSTLMMILTFTAVTHLAVTTPFVSNTVFQKWLGFKTHSYRLDDVDYGLIGAGLLSELIVQVCLALATKTSQVYALFLVFSLGQTLPATLIAGLSKFYKPSRVGQMLISTEIISNISNVVFPPIMLQVYKVSLLHGAANLIFFILAGTGTISLAFLMSSRFLK